MALTTQKSGSSIEDAFVADRAMFWGRFTSFAKYAAIAISVVLLLVWFLFG